MKRTILLSIIALAAVISTNATTYYVKSVGGTPAANAASATSWSTACADLQAVINVAGAGDEIRVAAGTYKPNSIVNTTDGTPVSTSDPRDNAFVLKEGVKIYGGFTAFIAGVAIPAFGSTDRNGVSILSGDIDNTPANITGNAYHVIIGADITVATVLDGFTVTGGNANGSNAITVNGQNISRDTGGGINNYSSSPALTNVTVSGNTAIIGDGGGIYNYNSSPALTNVTVSGNSAGNGGGIYNNNSSPALTNVTVSGNTASNNGGGIYDSQSAPTLTNVAISGNLASSHGGGISNHTGSTPTLINVTISGNSATTGGGIYNVDGIVTIQNSIVAGNTASDAPDCWVHNYGTMFIYASYSLIGNTAHTSGTDVTQVSNCIVDTDPQFVDWQNPASVAMPNTAGNYRLPATSPAIGAGYNTYNSESTDLDGNPRLCGVNIDMGAYEYQPGGGGKIYVRKGSTGNGSSWTNACGELADALYAAQTNTAIHEIWVAAGTYKPLYKAGDGTQDRDKAFVLVEGVKIYGGFTTTTFITGGAIPAFGSGDRNGVSILSGDIDNTPADITGNAYHVVIGARNITNATVLDGFTVTGGNADGGSSTISVNGINFVRYHGGGIYNATSSPTIINVTVSGNSAYHGGGIYNTASSPTLTNVTVSGNSASYMGGGIYNTASSPTLTNVTVSGNSAHYGGGIYNVTSLSPRLTNVTVSGNSAIVHGGGIYNSSSSSPTLTNVTVSGNSADSGGGIDNYSGTVTLNNTLVWGNNSSGVDGAGVYNYNYSLVQGVAASGTNLAGSIDPLFASPLAAGLNTGGDYTLRAGSPAIGAGNNANYTGGLAALATATDLAGNPRRFGNNIDLGAYEADAYLATFRFGSPRPDSIARFASPYLLTAPSSDPDSTGYTFGGWYADALCTTAFNFPATLTQDTTVYAKWTIITYPVTFKREPGITLETQTVNHGSPATAPSPAPDSTGYTFGGWYTSSALTTAFDFAGAITHDSTLHAKWTLNSYPVTFEREPGITLEMQTVNHGSPATAPSPAPDSTGYTFGGWYADAVWTTPFNFAGAITRDSTVYAKWDIAGYTVTYLRKPGVIHATQTVNHGSPATAPSAPDSTGYTFGGWYADATLTTAFNFAGVITHDSTLHAKWTLIPPPPLEIGGLPLPPLEGTGTPDDPFTGDVTVPIYTENLLTEDIYTGDDTDVVTFYTDPGHTQPVRGLDLYTGETTTVYIAIKVGNMTFYYAIAVTRSDEFTPLIRRSVKLPLIDGVVTDPPAGVHLVNSGRDFVFTLTPTGVGLYSNTSPLVRTGRDNLSDDVVVTLTGVGTYTVRIRAVRSDITLSIDLTTANAEVATAKVWSYKHTLYIYMPRATARHVSTTCPGSW